MTGHFSSLTSKQKKAYTAIETYIKLKGFPPTVREIGEMVGEKTPGAVQGILNRLELKGIIKRQLGAARSIQLISESQMYADPVYIPEIKKISKRNIDDLVNIYNIIKYHPVSPDLLSAGSNYIIISCPDDSLSDSGIRLQDMLFINISGGYKSGDIVLAFYETHTLLRYYHAEDQSDMITLKADTDFIGKETFKPDEVRIIGKLDGKYTKY